MSTRSYATAVPEHKEIAVPIVAVFQPPNFTQEQYEESVVKVTGGKTRVGPQRLRALLRTADKSHADSGLNGQRTRR